ncbi:MAG: hypothetical protein IPK19_03460 [Chloroflexi bacterium]|nr:hypothetical protein [Chloroflexota bacterium]
MLARRHNLAQGRVRLAGVEVARGGDAQEAAVVGRPLIDDDVPPFPLAQQALGVGDRGTGRDHRRVVFHNAHSLLDAPHLSDLVLHVHKAVDYPEGPPQRHGGGHAPARHGVHVGGHNRDMDLRHAAHHGRGSVDLTAVA